MVLGPIAGRTLGATVVQALRQAISDGELAVGERIIDSEIAERLKVSRATVRDALRQLTHEGLVINYPHRGYFVADFRPSDVMELLEMRSLLEGKLAEAAAPFLTDVDFARLDDMAGAIERRDYLKDSREIQHLDIAFHQIIADRCPKPLLVELWTSLNSRMIRLDRLWCDVLKLDAADSARRHRAYIAELRTGNPARAQKAGEAHYRYHRERYREFLQAREAVD